MSASPAGTAARSAAGRRPEHSRVPLVAVPLPPSRAPRAPFIGLVIGLLGGGLVVLLLLNTALAQGAFALHDLQRHAVTLTEQQQALTRRLADQQQPRTLARRARELGLVSGGAPAFLRLPDGKVIGTPHAAGRPPAPAVDVPPPTALRTGEKAAAKQPKTTKAPAKASTKAKARTKAQGKAGAKPAAGAGTTAHRPATRHTASRPTTRKGTP